MITDLISLPRLIELFGESNYSRRNLEEQLISAIDVVDPNILSKNCCKQTVCYTFKFDPATVAFIVMLLSLFEITKFKIDELEPPRPTINNDKLKLAIHAREQELREQSLSSMAAATPLTLKKRDTPGGRRSRLNSTSPPSAIFKPKQEESVVEKKSAPELYCKIKVSGKSLTVELVKTIIETVQFAFTKVNQNLDPTPRPAP